MKMTFKRRLDNELGNSQQRKMDYPRHLKLDNVMDVPVT